MKRRAFFSALGLVAVPAVAAAAKTDAPKALHGLRPQCSRCLAEFRYPEMRRWSSESDREAAVAELKRPRQITCERCGWTGLARFAEDA